VVGEVFFWEVGFGGQKWKYLWLVFGKKLLGVKMCQRWMEKERNVERNSDNSEK